ncbi:uncharacterized protein TRAVEDRAFT_37033 [Trametes versicolor FP-101664 SS1]|uniref:uncharacterized protein n=1 Tax=Trametes versicolor (strain FP-101664) TaxID=717944 RepID=UPI000462323E|nr:uncharacterized protein TRAVEDRAFT_37033 [Trametes versicolor FP-101664 SS1]EIW59755.1 hypothetical protein TRAVEDRAFT_37033 [Trametes versicolor FP-101664 SS1]
MGDEVAEMFNQALEEMLLSIEESLCKAGEAISTVIGFIDAKGEHVKLLGHLQATAHFDRIASSLQGPPPAQELSAVARDALNVLRLTLHPIFSLVDRSGEEVERVVAELRSLGVEEVNRGVVDDKMTGLVRIRDDLGVLQEVQPARLATFSRALQSPAAVPISIRDEAFNVDLEFLDAMTVSLTFAQADDTMKEVVGGVRPDPRLRRTFEADVLWSSSRSEGRRRPYMRRSSGTSASSLVKATRSFIFPTPPLPLFPLFLSLFRSVWRRRRIVRSQ